MLPVVLAAVAAFAAARTAAVVAAAQGRQRPAGAAPPVRGTVLLAVALAAQVLAALAHVGESAQEATLLASYVLAAAFLLLNRRRRGMVVAAAGLAANAAVVALNGSMPVSLRAAGRAGLDPASLALGPDPRHEVLTGATRLPWLADVVPLPVPLLPEVVSAGDLVCAAGVALAVWAAGRGVAARTPADTHRPSRPADGGDPAAAVTDAAGTGADGRLEQL